MKLQLAPFSLAFAVSDNQMNELGPAEQENLRSTTSGYLQHKLKLLYPSLQGLDLAFTSFQNQVGDPHAEFHICMETKVAVFFENDVEKPDAMDVLTKLFLQFDEGYIPAIWKAFSDYDTPLTRATNMKVQMLKQDTTAMATTAVPVTISNVYVAFSMPECEVQPSYNDLKALVKTTQDFFFSALRKKFESFRGMSLSVRRHIFDKAMPDANYNMYVELEFVVSFMPSEEGTVPGQYLLGQVLVGADFDKFFKKHIKAAKGTPFAGATNISIGQVEEN